MEDTLKIDQVQPIEAVVIKDNSKRAKVAILIFWILTAVTVIAVISDYVELQLLKKGQFGGFITEEAANANDMRQGIIGMVQTVLYLTSVIVFLSWFRRAYGNLGRLGIKLRHKENMAVFSWFIPFMVWFWPVQIMKEIWTETQRVIRRRDRSYIIKSGSLAIGVWWLLFLFSNFVGRYVLKTAFGAETLEDLILCTEAYLISDLLQIPEALLVLFIVYRVSGMESRMAEEVERTAVQDEGHPLKQIKGGVLD